jgi:Zn-dependent M28 family amino/carboxypeptidase
MQKEIVSRLSGAMEIRPGLTLADRRSMDNKQEVRAYLAHLLEQLGLEPKTQDYSTEGRNVYAVLSCGRPSSQTIVLGAHYDTVPQSPGANDNATGVALVAAVAREMVRVKDRRQDLLIVFFDEEERGMKGSKAFAQMLKAEDRQILAVYTVDQMGWDQDGDRAIELEMPYGGAADLVQKAADSLGLKVPIEITSEAGSDHSSFRDLGYKAVGITEEYRNKDTTPHIHTPKDTLDTIDFGYLNSTTQLMTKVLEMILTGG